MNPRSDDAPGQPIRPWMTGPRAPVVPPVPPVEEIPAWLDTVADSNGLPRLDWRLDELIPQVYGITAEIEAGPDARDQLRGWAELLTLAQADAIVDRVSFRALVGGIAFEVWSACPEVPGTE